MHNRDKSVFSVIDTTPGQHDCPLPLWGMAAVELWEKNENEGNKYKEIEQYQFVNYFPIEAFKIKFFAEFEIYKKEYPEGIIETFRKKEYQQFIYDCGDIIEMIGNQDYYYWTTVRGFDFYLQQMKGWKNAYVMNKDPHTHEINLRALLQFLKTDCVNDFQDKVSDLKENTLEEYLMVDKTENNKIIEKKIRPELTINQIALKLVYEEVSLPREKANEIITNYGHTSGEKLFQRFSFYCNTKNRRDPKGTLKVLENKIDLFEKVIELLPENKKSKAIDEVRYLKGFLENLE